MSITKESFNLALAKLREETTKRDISDSENTRISQVLTEKGYFPNLPAEFPCWCPDKECITEDLFFECESCHRTVPYCRGADDKYPDFCDDCWAA